MKIKEAFSLAVENVATHGDTDVFPFPVDNAIFNDLNKDIVDLLDDIEHTGDFNSMFNIYPLVTTTDLTSAGYTGFRAVTQIDPIWNAYLLGAIISIGENIENARISIAEQSVFSYRFSPDKESGRLFQKDVGWRNFQLESNRRSENAEYIIACDISDFYSRIYHHRLENLLQRTTESHLVKRIMTILTKISKNTSYGLPIGGPAARILSELLLNTTDRMLEVEGISFVRFADDYHLFADTKHDAYRYLIYLSEKLQNEGLSLQKTKTRIVTKQEFLATSEFSEQNQPTTEEESNLQKFRSLSLFYDPYSLTADDDYFTLKEALSQFDITEMLQAEFRKSRIHQPTTKKLLSVIKHLEPKVKVAIVKTIIENIEILTPVIPNVMIVLKDIVKQADDEVNQNIFSLIHSMFKNNSPLTSLPINVSYSLRLLASDSSTATDALINSIYNKAESLSLRRDVINTMTHRGADFWLSDKLKKYASATEWEKRALLIASYSLTDEGSHWRQSIKNTHNKYDETIKKWVQQRKQDNKKGLPI